MSAGRIMGIDIGDKRVGVAISDPTGFLASAHSVLIVQSPAHAANEVARLCRETGVIRVVVGMPLNMDGSKGPAAQKTAAFIEDLKPKINLPIVTWDERLSTKAAHDILMQSGKKAPARRGIVDKVAAEIILQGYLDSQPMP